MDERRNLMTEDHDSRSGSDQDMLTFAKEDAAGPVKNDNAPWKIMIVDDEKAIHSTTMRVLEGITFENRPLSYLNAYSGASARLLMRENPDTALILLDVVMETDDEGLNFVRYIREELKNHLVRIILRTGQPGHAPERKVIMEYDINDYKLKSMLGDQGLFTAVISALRNYRDVMIIEQNRKQIEIASAKAKDALIAKYQFLSNMTHEFHTPLNAIIGFSSVLSEMELTEEQQDYINSITDAGHGLLTVLSNVIEISEMAKGRLILDKFNYSLRKLVDEVMSIIDIQAGWKKLDTNCEIAENVPDYLTGDPRRLKQVLMNVLINAVRHTMEGYIFLNVTLYTKGPEKQILFSLVDTGVGIPKAMHDRIFEPFTLGEEKISKRFGGAGLGLSISKNIVEKMGGKIWVTSTQGQGSTFHFSIKLVQAK
jgi:signal transduction histidine kinase